MSSFSSIYSSLSGLFGFSRALDNASDNIANMNTTGYKGRDLSFRELTMDDGQSAGVGVSGSILRQQQGDINETGNATDLAINGEGFFILREGENVAYTRSGQFQFDQNGYLIDPASGRRVAALTASGTLVDVQIDRAKVSAGIETTLVELAGNLDSGLGQGEVYPGEGAAPIEFQIFDPLGQAHVLRATFTKTADNSWSVQLTDQNDIKLGDSFAIGFDEVTGEPLPGQNSINFSYQPFELIDADNFSDFLTSTGLVVVPDGDLTGALDIAVSLDDGFSLLVSSGADAGVEVAASNTFRFDAEGNFINSVTGQIVQSLNEMGELENLSIAELLENSGSPTEVVTFSGNIDSSIPVGSTLPEPVVLNLIDSSGTQRTLNLFLTKDINNTWLARIEDSVGNVLVDETRINFGADGQPTAARINFDYNAFGPFTSLPITDILEDSEPVTLGTAGDLSTSGQLSLALNEEGSDENASFLLRNNNDYEFSQSSNFNLDSEGFLVTSEGLRLTSVDEQGLVSDINLSEYIELAGNATAEIAIRGNFDPASEIGQVFPPEGESPVEITVFDADGEAQELGLRFEKLQDNQWQMRISEDGGEPIQEPIVLDFDPVTGALLSETEFPISYQSTENLSTAVVASLIEVPPPINVVAGDPSSSVPAQLSLDQADAENGAYFVTRSGFDRSYVQSGSFAINAEGFLIDLSSGERVAGLSSNGELEDLNFSEQLVSPAIRTTNVQLAGFLNTGEAAPQTFSVTVFDEDGGSHNLTLVMAQSGTSNQWDLQVFDENGVNIGEQSTAVDIIFSNAGTPLVANEVISYDPLNTGNPTSLTFNFTGVRAPTTAPQLTEITEQANNGRASGVVSQIEFTEEAEILFSYSNGDIGTAARIAVKEILPAVLDFSLELSLTEDGDFGNDIDIASNDGVGASQLTGFYVDGSGVMQFEYANETTVSGPEIGIVERAGDTASNLRLDFSSATSIGGEDTNLIVANADGTVSGSIVSYQIRDDGVVVIDYANGETAEGPRVAIAEEVGTAISGLEINFGSSDGITSRASGSSNIQVGDINGRAVGNLVGVSFDEEGFVVTEYSNNESIKSQRIGLALFDDPNELKPLSGSFFSATGSVATRNLGYASTNAFGSISPNSLELSNVDLTSEFGSIIIIQRGYQAASQALNATNEVIEELFNTLR